MCLRAKRPPEDTRWRSSQGTPPHESPVRQRSGLAATEECDQEDDGRSPSDKGNRPRDRAEWTMVLRYGRLHRSWWTLFYTRSGNRLHSAHPCVNSTRPTWRVLDDLFPLPARIRVRCSQSDVDEKFLGVWRQIMNVLLPLRAVGVAAVLSYFQTSPSWVHWELTGRVIVASCCTVLGIDRCPLAYALAGCGRRCATLFAQGNAFPPDTVRVSQTRVQSNRLCREVALSLKFSCLHSARSRCQYRSERPMKLASPSFKGLLRCPLCCKPHIPTQQCCIEIAPISGFSAQVMSPLFLLRRAHACISKQQCGMESDECRALDQNFKCSE